ncbi:MAG: tRNA (N6-threonylcarbamoyladenosine(37)-N6)-methyltransferase TrmO [Bacteroidales bacterium]|nr:tRNA (N6-threonylcarbamoyladenosine(37)-N6)-methyltransferase TrmO [Bacteroidales bacterium]
MNIEPVAVFHSPVSGKFGVPRQSGLAESLKGEVELLPPFNREEALRGLEGFDYIWLVWEFSLNEKMDESQLTVRPPRLGGNTRVGVFASRSPFRPNRLGLSSVRIDGIDAGRGVIRVLGADLADGTPIYDIKPYVPYADSHPDARGGFTDSNAWKPLKVDFREMVCGDQLTPSELEALAEILSQDPRPQYQDDPQREYGLLFAGHNVRFKVADNVLTVISIDPLNQCK